MNNEQMAELLVEKLECSLNEAYDVIETDKKIEGGADPYPLSKEQKQAVRKATQGLRKKTSTRTRKRDENKYKIMSLIVSALKLDCTMEIINPEREILLNYKGTKYKLVLSCPRK